MKFSLVLLSYACTLVAASPVLPLPPKVLWGQVAEHSDDIFAKAAIAKGGQRGLAGAREAQVASEVRAASSKVDAAGIKVEAPQLKSVEFKAADPKAKSLVQAMEERDQIQNRLVDLLKEDIAKQTKIGNHAEAARQQGILNNELKKLQTKPDVGDELTRRFQRLMDY